jgi:cytochrome d ubiquinol oxidase subunit I
VTDVLFARGQMALSLAFHIVFAAIGIGMPVLMVAAEALTRRTGDPDYRTLALRWARGTAVLFAVGAVSGTVLAFELGLLFPGFMRAAGAVIGMPFSLEGFAFFTEAIFLGIFLYGRDRLSSRLHVFAGIVVAVSGLASAVFVTLANAWMNAPRGFRVAGGAFVDIDPLAAMASPFAAHEIVHTALAAYAATGVAVAGLHALALLRARRAAPAGAPDGPLARLHRKALGIALAMAVPAALAQPIVGHWAGQEVAILQPAKLAAMEGLVHTGPYAPLRLGPITIRGGLSVLAFNRPDAVVKGLEELPRADWPHPVVETAFLAMVVAGFAMAGLAAWAIWRFLRRRRHDWSESRLFLLATALAAPLGFLAMEAGWIVTEVGRQPWIVYGILRTADAVTPMPGLAGPFVAFAAVYAFLAVVVVAVMWRQVRPTISDAAPEKPR